MEFNTHTRSPAWGPLKKLFIDNAAAFLVANQGKTYTEKHHIGAAMWEWMLSKGLVPDDLRTPAEQVHFRPTKEKNGLPLWRLAYLRSIRNTPQIDQLFVGARKGPTPRYARLASAGLVPQSPRDFVPDDVKEQHCEAVQAASKVEALLADEEWSTPSEGTEWVYAYSTRREIENYRSQRIAPMVKVGCTRQHYSSRVAAQFRGTASNSSPVVLFAYRTSDGQALESAIHRALHFQGRHVKDAPGVEWFEIEPESFRELVSAICGGCTRVDVGRNSAGTQYRE